MSITCPKCRSDNPETLRFCGNCGTKLDASEFGRPQGHEDRASFTRTVETGAGELIRGMTFAGRYEIIEELGTGGMGGAYRARDESLNRDVAIKVMRKSYGDDPAFVETFRHEAQAAAKLNHPNVVQIHSFGEATTEVGLLEVGLKLERLAEISDGRIGVLFL